MEWRWPVVLGATIAVAMWAIWYFTKVPCIMARAEEGLCNPSVLASVINVDIVAKAGGGGLAVGALKGGYDRYMLNREREARRLAEEQLAEARIELDAQRKRANEAHERANEERERAHEERERVIVERERAIAEREQAAAALVAEREQAAAALLAEREQAAAALLAQREQVARETAVERQRADEAYIMINGLVAEFREERQQSAANQQAMLDAMNQLLRQQTNGGRPTADDSDSSTHE